MKTYKKPDSTLFAFEEDGSQDHLISSDMVLITEEEADAIRIFKPSKISRINALQDQYEIDRNKLNLAWLSAIIADGEGETARKAVISSQMTELDTQLQSDIMTILSEE